MNPQNSNELWVGTGENVGGRHVSYGDGIYKSTDVGNTWKNMGLKRSEHISKIIIHPHNSDIIWVVSRTPVEVSGGDRGIYKSTDGGKHGLKLLVMKSGLESTDILIDPRNPNLLYATC